MRQLAMSHLTRIYIAILLLNFDWNPYLQQWMCPNVEMEESLSETRGWKERFNLQKLGATFTGKTLLPFSFLYPPFFQKDLNIPQK